jgi:hypothetical protein
VTPPGRRLVLGYAAVTLAAAPAVVYVGALDPAPVDVVVTLGGVLALAGLVESWADRPGEKGKREP